MASVGKNFNGQLGTGDYIESWVYNGNVTINCFVAPAAAYAGPDQEKCVKGTISLSGSLPPADAFVVWRKKDGLSTLINDSTVSPQALTPSTGLNSFVYYISVSGCGFNTDTVDIMVNDQQADAGNLDSICVGDPFTLDGNGALVGAGSWTKISVPAGTVSIPSDSNSAVTGLTGSSVNLFEWAINISPSCGITRDTVEIRVKASPTIASLGIDTIVCENTLFNITGNTPSIGTGKWSINSPTGSTIVDPNSVNTDINLKINLSTVYWTISNGPCAASVDSIKITGQSNPLAPNAGGTDTICITQTTFQLSGSDPTPFTGKWSLISGSGAFTDDTKYDSIVSGYSQGDNKYEWKLTNGVCTQADTMLLVVKQLPTTANAGTNDSVCYNGSIVYNLDGNVPSFGIGKWSVISPGSTSLTDADSPTSVVDLTVGALNKIEWSITSGQCPASKDTIEIFGIGSPLIAAAGLNNEDCDTFRTMNGSSPGIYGQGKWSVRSGCGRIIDDFDPITGVDSLCYGDNVFYWTVGNAGSCVTFDSVTITVTIPDTLLLERYVATTNVLSTLNTGLTNIQWYKDSVAIAGANSNEYTMIIDSGVCANYYLEANVDANSGCKGVSLIENFCGSVGIEEELLSLTKLIPNPTSGELNIMLDRNLEKHFSYSIYNSIGKLVMREYVNSYQRTINISNFDKGMYFVRIEQGKHQVMKKIIKQ